MRCLLFTLVLAGCGAPTLTRPNPPPEPAPTTSGAPYAGRIELEAPAAHGYARETWSVLRRRLALLEVEARVTFDAQRAVIDVYGADPSGLTALADRLADPMEPGIVGAGGEPVSLRFAEVRVVGRPRPGCECKAVVRLELPEGQLRSLASPPFSPGSGRTWTMAAGLSPSQLTNAGALTGLDVLRVLVEWEWIGEPGTWRAVAALVHLAPPGDELGAHLYLLGGGAHPGPVVVRAVTPRRAS